MLIHSPERLGDYIRDIRKVNKLSQTDVANTVGLKQATISGFENNPDNSRLDTLFRILAATDLELHLVPRGVNIIVDTNPQPEDDSW